MMTLRVFHFSLNINSGDTSLNYIGSGAFQNCSSLIGILNIPDNVTSIDNFAFNNDSSLNSLFINPNNTKWNYIGRFAFNNCNSLTGTLNIPNSVTSIDYYAFNVLDSSSLNSVYIKPNNTSFKYCAWSIY